MPLLVFLTPRNIASQDKTLHLGHASRMGDGGLRPAAGLESSIGTGKVVTPLREAAGVGHSKKRDAEDERRGVSGARAESLSGVLSADRTYIPQISDAIFRQLSSALLRGSARRQIGVPRHAEQL